MKYPIGYIGITTKENIVNVEDNGTVLIPKNTKFEVVDAEITKAGIISLVNFEGYINGVSSFECDF